MKFNQNTQFFIHAIASENIVWEMADILSVKEETEAKLVAWLTSWQSTSWLQLSRVSNSYDQPQLPPTEMATAENGETKQSRISGKPDRALWPYDTDTSVSYHTMYFSYDHVF